MSYTVFRLSKFKTISGFRFTIGCFTIHSNIYSQFPFSPGKWNFQKWLREVAIFVFLGLFDFSWHKRVVLLRFIAKGS
jgi:hypothetical protein